MKPENPRLRTFLLVIAAFIAATLATADAANTAKNGGRIIMKHSPVLGLNVVVGVTIDGQAAGSFAKGHTFERVIPPGRHTISAFVNGRQGTAARLTLDVRPGETYSYVAKYHAGKIVLEATAKPR